MSELSRNRLFALHGWLLAAAIGLSAQETAWSWLIALPLCTAINLLLWLLVTRRETGRKAHLTLLRRLPLLLVLPSVYLAGLLFRFAWLQHVSLLFTAVSVVSILLTFVLAALVYMGAKDADALLFGLAITGAIVCLEGLGHEWVKTHGFLDLILRSPYRRDIVPEEITRLSYPIAYPNALATVLLFFSACTMGALAASRRMPMRLFWLLVLLLHFACIVLTGSRGGLISMVFLPLAFVGRQIRVGRWIATAGAALVIAAVAWMLRKPYARLRGSGSLLQRAHGWIVTLKIATRSPWFGEGPNAFSQEWAMYGPAHGYANQFGLDGFYANLLCSGGIVSLTVLSTLTVAAGREVKRLLYSTLPAQLQTALYYLAVGLGVVLIHNIVETTLSAAPIVLGAAILFGLVTAFRCREGQAETSEINVDWKGTTYSSGRSSSGPRRQPA